MTDPDLPDLEIQALPLDAWHRDRQARIVAFAGYHMPIQYEGILPEHLWTRAHAGLFDVSHMGQLLISGAGAGAALEALLPGDVTGLAPGRLRYSLLMAESGGILDDLMVTRLPADAPLAVGREGDVFYMVVNGATKYDDIAHLHEHLPETVTLNHMDEAALLALQGPEAVAALARVVPGVDALTFLSAAGFDWRGHQLWISRSGYTGEDGFEISLPVAAASDFASALCAEPQVKPIGLGARDSLRLEAGLPLYGHDLDPDTSPVMADLGFAVAKRRREEGGFPGHARLLAERADGPAATRVGLLVDGRQPVREGARVLDVGGNEVGRVTSGGHSPSLGRPIAMAYAPPALAAEGAPLTLEQRGKLFAATVVPMPFVPHRYVRKGAQR